MLIIIIIIITIIGTAFLTRRTCRLTAAVQWRTAEYVIIKKKHKLKISESPSKNNKDSKAINQQLRHLIYSLNAKLKRKVLSVFSKVLKVVEAGIAAGRVFHSRGAALAKVCLRPAIDCLAPSSCSGSLGRSDRVGWYQDRRSTRY